MREYYPFDFIIKNKNYFCCWYTNDIDGFLLNENKLIYFNTIEQLKVHALKYNMQLNMQSAVSVVSIDQINKWLEINDNEVNCKAILEFWNIIGDIAHSIGADFYGDEKESVLTTIYDKLFWGNNMSIVTPSTQIYLPKWEQEEVKEIRKVLINGLDILYNAIY